MLVNFHSCALSRRSYREERLGIFTAVSLLCEEILVLPCLAVLCCAECLLFNKHLCFVTDPASVSCIHEPDTEYLLRLVGGGFVESLSRTGSR